jgi:hypothetical protein
MGINRFIIRAGSVCCALVLAAVAVPSTASAHGGGRGHSNVRVLAEGLSSPKGVATNADGDPVVAQGAFGPPGPVLIFPQRGPDRGTAIPATDAVNLTDVAISPKDDTGWGIGPGEVPEHVYLYHQLSDGTIDTVLDITAYQAGDPDPNDQEGIPTESNPYGLTIDRRGNALVADAAGNDLIRVTPSGEAKTVARFDVEMVKTNHLPPEMGVFPPKLTAEAVPTSVTIGPDGAIYVGTLNGFPFRPGAARVWRIDPRANGVLCSVNTPSHGCKVYARGLTAIQDIAFGPKDHKLYVLELAKDGVLAFEAGFETGEFPPAVLLKVSRHGRTELAKGKLSQPGGLAFSRHGKLYVTDGTFGNGRLLRVL